MRTSLLKIKLIWENQKLGLLKIELDDSGEIKTGFQGKQFRFFVECLATCRYSVSKTLHELPWFLLVPKLKLGDYHSPKK